MKLAKLMRRLGGLCFLLIWVPFGVIMLKGPLSIMMNGPETTMNNMSGDIFGDMGIWWTMMIVLGFLTPMLIVGSFVVRAIANKRVISTGQDAEAKILAINDTGTRINNNPVVKISLEVHPIDQSAFAAEVRQTISVIHLPSYQPGKTVSVKYVPGTDKVAIIGAIVA